MKTKEQKENITSYISRIYLVFILFSFIGWIWETIHVSILASEFINRGFLFGPICPIYGITITIAYLFFVKIKKTIKLKGEWYKNIVYYLVIIILPTIIELMVGWGFEQIFEIRLWDYSHYIIKISEKEYPLHFNGYIALPISLIWPILIIVSTEIIIPYSFKLFNKVESRKIEGISLIIAIVMFIDIVVSTIINLPQI